MTEANRLDKLDPTFVEDLERSHESVRAVKKWLEGKGFEATIPPTIVRPSSDERFDYSDNGDIHLTMRTEVKHRVEIPFTDRASFPFGTVIVDKCHKYDKARPKPYVYVICNKPLTHAMLVYPRTTARKWTVEKRFFNGRDNVVYECHLNLVHFVELSEAPI